MTENKRYRVFKYIDCEKYGVSDDVAEYTLARFDNHFEAEGLCDLLNELAEENEQLKSELSRYKEVNRLDIWKSSYSSEDALITELQNKCDKKQEHIVVLENKIHRMREAIHKLEWLATHRNGELIRENELLKIDLGIAEDNRKLDKEIIDDIHNEFQKVKEENEQLKNKIDVLEDDNETYSKSLEKLNLYTKRFIPTKCTNEFKDCKTNRYYWLDHEGNFDGALELLNLLDCENGVLKSENRQLKGRLMEYEEQIKGDVE